MNNEKGEMRIKHEWRENESEGRSRLVDGKGKKKELKNKCTKEWKEANGKY